VVNRQKRGAVFDGVNGARYGECEGCRKRFDPLRFGSSDRFSHGFGKRRISDSADTASVCLLLSFN